MEVQIDKEKVADRKLDSKSRISIGEFADPGATVEIAVLEVKKE